MEVMLILNSHELAASIESAEAVVLAVASGTLDRQTLTDCIHELSWISLPSHAVVAGDGRSPGSSCTGRAQSSRAAAGCWLGKSAPAWEP